MSKEDEISSAFGSNAGNTNEATDWKSKAEELERQLQRERVEGGRLKKTNEELDALRKENAALKAKNRTESLLEVIPQEERDELTDGQMNATARVASKAADDLRAEFDERMARIENMSAAAKAHSRSEFNERVHAFCPKFFSDIQDGGDKAAAWSKYKRFNEASIVSANENCDFEAIKYHITNFYRSELGVDIPSGTGGSAAPEPSPAGGGGGAQVGSGKIYTQDEFNGLFDQKEQARDRGDWAEVRRITDEINRASAEGRIK